MIECLPDDVVRLVLQRCTFRAVVSLGCTCRRFKALADAVPLLPRVTLTLWQPMHIETWARANAHRIRDLVAKKCLYGEVPWLSNFTRLQYLTVAFCRLRPQVFEHLPPSLVALDVHMLVASASTRLSFAAFPRLRSLKLVFDPLTWDMAFVRKLPRGLRRLELRGARVLGLESHMPKGLRTVSVHSQTLLVVCNRLPNGVRHVHLSCSHGRMWIRDVLPLKPRKLETLSLWSPSLSSVVPGLAAMTRLRSLAMHADSLCVRWSSLARAPALAHLTLVANHWMATTDVAWPMFRRLPDVGVSVAGMPAPLILPPLTTSQSAAPAR